MSSRKQQSPDYSYYWTHKDENVKGTSGDDVIITKHGDDTIKARAGNDEIHAGKGNDTVHGGQGDDHIFGEQGCDSLYGGVGHDYIDGGKGNDDIRGGKGNDILLGGFGHDCIYGGQGNDVIMGGKGHDYLQGNAGDDELDGGRGNDTLYGGKGNDIARGGEGFDQIYLGKGNDQGIYNFAINPTGHHKKFDYYDGGKGDDTLIIELEAGQNDLKQDILDYFNAFTPGSTIDFRDMAVNGFALKVSNFETILVNVPGGNNLPPTITSSDTISIEENTADVVTVTATDPENDPITFSISGGDDQALFSINPNSGQLSFNTAPDFEMPMDNGADNEYQVEVTANDGTNNTMQLIHVTVTNDPNEPPIAVNDAYTLQQGGTLNTLGLNQSLTIEEIINMTGDGLGNAFDGPESIVVNAAGDIFVSAINSNNVFKIDGITQQVTELIDSTGDGLGNALANPFAITLDHLGNLYIAGEQSDNVFKIDAMTNQVTELIDSTGDGLGNTLDAPFGLSVDNNLNVYVAGRNSGNIFKIESNGTISELIDLPDPVDIKASSSGFVYVVSRSTDSVFRFDPTDPSNTNTVILNAAGDGLGNTFDVGNFLASGLVVDSLENVYVAGSNSDNVFKIESGGTITEVLDSTGDGLGNTLNLPQGLSVDDLNNLYVAGTLSSNVFKVSLSGQITEIMDNSNGLNIPDAKSVTTDDNGNVYVTSFSNDQAFKIPPPVTLAGQIADATGTANLSDPDGIDVDTNGNVFVASSGNNTLVKIATDGTSTILLNAGDGLNLPVGVAVDSQGNSYVAGYSSHNVFKVSADGTMVTEILTNANDGVLNPFDIAVDSSDNVYVTGFGSKNVYKIETNGTVTEILSESDLDVDNNPVVLTNPFGIAVDLNDNVYVAGNDSNNVYKIATNGDITEVIDGTGDGVNPLTKVTDVAVDSTGNIYAIGNGSDNLFKISADLTTITEILDNTGGLIDNPTGLDIDDNDNLYVTSFNSDNILQVKPDGTITEIFKNGDNGLAFNGPADDTLAVDQNGVVYATGTLSDNIIKIEPPIPPAPTQGVLFNDSDPENDALTAILDQGPQHASQFDLNPNGSFTYVHDGSSNALDSFTYIVTDGVNFSAPATATLGIEVI